MPSRYHFLIACNLKYNLCTSSKTSFNYNMSMIKGVLLDISGTLIVGDTPTHGAIEAIERLSKVLPVRFITNSSKESSQSLHNLLKKAGFNIDKNHIFSSLSATKRFIQKYEYRPLLLLEEEAMLDFTDVDQTNPNAVVVGLSPSKLNYMNLNNAFRIIKNQKGILIAIHKSRYFKDKDDLSLGPGPFVEALEHATDSKAILIGNINYLFNYNRLE